jgi:hypothetical protein
MREGSRYTSTLVIAAAIIAAVRLAREEIDRPTPRVVAAVSDSITLARSLLEGVAALSAGELNSGAASGHALRLIKSLP